MGAVFVWGLVVVAVAVSSVVANGLVDLDRVVVECRMVALVVGSGTC